MKKMLAVLMAWLLVCAAAVAEPQQLVTAERAVELPEGYYLLNGNTIGFVSEDAERWTAMTAAQGADFATEKMTEGVDVVLTDGGAVALEIKNAGFVGGNHTRMPELEATIRGQFETELRAKGAAMPAGGLVRQYAGKLHLAAFASVTDAQGQPATIGRIVTINDAGNMIEIWSHVDEVTTAQLMETLGREAAEPEPTQAPEAAEEAAPGVQTQAEILATLGMYDFDSLSREHVENVVKSSEGDMQIYNISLADGVYVDDYAGYAAEWRTGTGVMSDVMYDLDSDGTDEYLIIYVSEEAGDYGGISCNLHFAVYEPVDGGYTLADECFVMEHSGYGQRWMGVVLGEDGRHLAVGERWYEDGGYVRLRSNIYSYDGAQLILNAVSGASANGEDVTYTAVGPMDPADMKAVREAVLGMEQSPEKAQQLGLVQGQNLFIPAESTGTPEAQMGRLQDVADRLSAYGLFIYLEQMDTTYVLTEIDFGDLLWLSEERTMDGSAAVDLMLRTTGATASAETNAPLEFVNPFAEPEPAEDMIRAMTDVNVRSGPGTDYDKLGMLKTGASAPYAGESQLDANGHEWLSIQFDGQTGWVSAQYVAN